MSSLYSKQLSQVLLSEHFGMSRFFYGFTYKKRLNFGIKLIPLMFTFLTNVLLYNLFFSVKFHNRSLFCFKILFLNTKSSLYGTFFGKKLFCAMLFFIVTKRESFVPYAFCKQNQSSIVGGSMVEYSSSLFFHKYLLVSLAITLLNRSNETRLGNAIRALAQSAMLHTRARSVLAPT